MVTSVLWLILLLLNPAAPLVSGTGEHTPLPCGNEESAPSATCPDDIAGAGGCATGVLLLLLLLLLRGGGSGVFWGCGAAAAAAGRPERPLTLPPPYPLSPPDLATTRGPEFSSLGAESHATNKGG